MEEKLDFKVVEVKRVAKVTEGGKRIKVRAVVVVGDYEGRVGVGIAKGLDFADAIEKGRKLAEKNIIEVPIVNGTLPYEVKAKYGAAEILLKPAKSGRGLVAGGVVRTLLSLAGYSNVVSKITGVTKNPLLNILVSLKALEKLRSSYSLKEKLKSTVTKK